MELDTCPYCEEKEVVLRKHPLPNHFIEYQVECMVCGACGPGNKLKESAVSDWNRVSALALYFS